MCWVYSEFLLSIIFLIPFLINSSLLGKKLSLSLCLCTRQARCIDDRHDNSYTCIAIDNCNSRLKSSRHLDKLYLSPPYFIAYAEQFGVSITSSLRTGSPLGCRARAAEPQKRASNKSASPRACSQAKMIMILPLNSPSIPNNTEGPLARHYSHEALTNLVTKLSLTSIFRQ